jgi:hypothetical protein
VKEIVMKKNLSAILLGVLFLGAVILVISPPVLRAGSEGEAKRYVYFISFAYTSSDGGGVANAAATLAKPVTSIEDIRAVGESIRKESTTRPGSEGRGFEDVVVNNFILLRTEK